MRKQSTIEAYFNVFPRVFGCLARVLMSGSFEGPASPVPGPIQTMPSTDSHHMLIVCMQHVSRIPSSSTKNTFFACQLTTYLHDLLSCLPSHPLRCCSAIVHLMAAFCQLHGMNSPLATATTQGINCSDPSQTLKHPDSSQGCRLRRTASYP